MHCMANASLKSDLLGQTNVIKINTFNFFPPIPCIYIYVCPTMARQGLFATIFTSTLCRGVVSNPRQSVELRQAGTLEGPTSD